MSLNLDDVVAQLEALKRLTVLQLLMARVPATYIAKALGIHPSATSRMLPAREIQKLAAERASETH